MLEELELEELEELKVLEVQGGGLDAWLRLLSPGLAAPPPGGLVAEPRDMHLQGDLEVTITVTVEA